jgi:hypothetical protein
MAPLVTSAGVALIWPVLAHNELVISGAALIVACVLAILPRRWRHAGTALPLSWRSCSSPCDRHPLVQLSPGQKPGLFFVCPNPRALNLNPSGGERSGIPSVLIG